MIADADVERAARELIERHGTGALALASEHADEAKAAADPPALDIALRVLTACERLLEDEGEPGPGGSREPAA